jgi:type II secretory pathway pseudopilin PulG
MERRTQFESKTGEDGYMLLVMIVMVAVILIALSVAAPIIAKDIRRDKEVESMHRQEEYVRALRLYYRKFKSYPPSMDALEKSNNVRYLRKQYIDPLTGKADWRIIHVGENQTTVKGFFGEPLGGLGSGGVGQIMGVGSARSGDSILTPNQQTTYDTWEFLYDPRIELLYAKSNILGGGGLGSQSASSFGSDAASGQSNSGSGTNGLNNGLGGTSGSSTGSSLGGFGSTSPTTPHQ